MRRVNETPSRIDVAVRKKPFHRTSAAPQNTFIDFASLFRDVYMYRPLSANLINSLDRTIQRFRTNGPQRVRRDADTISRTGS